MTIIWSENAKDNINSYKQNSKIFKVEEYIKELIEYTDYLQNSPKMGKLISNKGNVEIRQLVFRMHRILYVINENTIIITSIVHTKRNMNIIIKYLNKYIKK